MTLNRPALLSALASAVLLAGCGGGAGSVGGGGYDTDAAAPVISPMYQLADLTPPVPGDAGAAGLDSRSRALAARGNGESASPAAAAAVTSYYTPAQIRAAYGLDLLDAAGPAHQGSGQTIAIITAFHNPGIANDLAVFSQKFGLAACSAQTLGAQATLPLPRPAAGSGCTLAVAYATAAGDLAAQAPAVDASWKTESSLDVEWAHAIAPMARILVVEAASAARADLLGAVNLAARLGAGVVSMSFASAEYAGQADFDSAFGAPGVTYLAASGDNGRGVSWPAVSTQVLAIGGSTMGLGSGARSESAWMGSGGGISSFDAAPPWQTALTVMATDGKVGTPTRRAVPDVAFNANPQSGQLIYVTPDSPADSGWLVAGGTSIGTPQWAGLIAIANAVRAADGKGPLGAVAAPLYRAMAGGSSGADALADVTMGSNGNCMGCGATRGYDLATGLGTPNGPAAIALMSGF